MNIALIFAGGTGHRMNTKITPKQFLNVNGKPIIIHTLEVFEQHPLIDAIVISCLSGYEEWLNDRVKQFNIKKVKEIVVGGKTGQLSIKNGLEKIYELFPDDSIVLIHDGVRPLVDHKTITKNIECVNAYGNAVTVTPATETVGVVDNEGSISEILKRDRLVICRAPQSFILRDVINIHRKFYQIGSINNTDTASLMRQSGIKLNMVEGSVYNIKITTQKDFYTFKNFLDRNEFNQLLEE